MSDDLLWLREQAQSSLQRLLPRIEARFGKTTEPAEWDAYVTRLKTHFPRLFAQLHALYGHHYDFFFHLESVLASATEMWLQRPEEMKALDGLRERIAYLAGDREHQAFYYMFPDREMPDAFEAHMPEVFSEDHPGAFTYQPRLKKWVWTTFHTYQWDLNYQNPVVINRMAEEMLFLAHQGVEIVRMDAVAFLWKRLGTNCQNLPEAHRIIQAFNAVAAIAAPATVLLSEAIVHPDEVRKSVAVEECPSRWTSAPAMPGCRGPVRLWPALSRPWKKGTRSFLNWPSGGSSSSTTPGVYPGGSTTAS